MVRGNALRKWQFLTLNGLGLLALVLVLVNISQFRRNRSLQAEINSRQQFINQSIQLSRLNNQIIQSLASLSAQTQDEQIRQLLAAHGITFTINPPQASAPSGSEDKRDKSTSK